MKITNKGNKIVHIGVAALLPEASITVADKLTETPAIKILVKHGILELTPDSAVEAGATTVAAEATETVAKTTSKSKSSSKSASKTATTEQ